MTNRIIELAREAGFNDSNGFSLLIVRHKNGSWVDVSEELNHFAALVRAQTLEEAAGVCEARSHRNDDMGAICADAIRKLKEKP